LVEGGKKKGEETKTSITALRYVRQVRSPGGHQEITNPGFLDIGRIKEKGRKTTG